MTASQTELITGSEYNIAPGKDWRQFSANLLERGSGQGSELSYTILGYHTGRLILEKTGDIGIGVIDVLAQPFANESVPPIDGENYSFFQNGLWFSRAVNRAIDDTEPAA
jgi:hypothetical protein